MGRKKKSREYMNTNIPLEKLANPKSKRDKALFSLRCILESDDDDPDYDEEDIIIPPDLNLDDIRGGGIYGKKEEI